MGSIRFDYLEKNLMDMLMEQQAKIGYMPETVRLYYPLESLNRMLDMVLDEDEMFSLLSMFADNAAERLGGIQVSHEGNRFCLALPPKMSALVHERMNTEDNAGYRFIKAFVDTISRHGCTPEQLRLLFEAHAGAPDNVHMERMSGEDFDYLFYFENGRPDSYRYCVTCEGPHLIYHRYTPADYAALFSLF